VWSIFSSDCWHILHLLSLLFVIFSLHDIFVFIIIIIIIIKAAASLTPPIFGYISKDGSEIFVLVSNLSLSQYFPDLRKQAKFFLF
jgi:hypothetical protein